MPSFSAVLNTAVPIVGSTERRFSGNIQECEHAVSELNLFASNNNAGLRALSCGNVFKRTFVSTYSPRLFVPRAVDQGQAQSGEDYSSAENAPEMAEDTIRGVANETREQLEDMSNDVDGCSSDKGQHPQSKGSGLDAVASQAEMMQRNLQRTGELVTGTRECATEDSKDWKKATENEMHESGIQASGDNNAAENAAEMGRETVSGLAKAGQEDPEDPSVQVEGPSQDFGDQARRFQENVQGQAQGFVETIKSGTSRASEKVQAAGRDMMHRADHAFGRSHDEDDDVLTKILILKPEDFEEAYIEIDDGSAKESILL